jgi:hypothetical protein
MFSPHRVLVSLAVVGLVVFGHVVPVRAAAADTVTVSGTYTSVVVDPRGPGQPSTTKSMITVGDATVAVPTHVGAGLLSGQRVYVEVDAPTGVDTAAEVEAALGAGEAEVVGATPIDRTTGSNEAAAVAPSGGHTLTVIPAYWSRTDGQTTASLTALAKKVGAFWSEQSRGGIRLSSVSVRKWTKIPAPRDCEGQSIASLHDNARRLAGVGTPSANAHVLVYFPSLPSCGWVGLAELSAGRIWINGYPFADGWEHEFGHNLGLGHSGSQACVDAANRPVSLSEECAVNAYDDFDVMGYARYGAGFSVNAAHADRLGLLNGLGVAAIGSVFSIPAITSTATNRAVRVDLPHTKLYVEYRPRVGRNAGEPASWAGVQVRELVGIDTLVVAAVPAATFAGSSPAKWLNRPWAIPGTNLAMVMEYADAGKARIRFRDALGTGALSAPIITAPAPTPVLRTALTTITWTGATSTAAAVAGYEMRVDGNTVATVPAGTTTANIAVPDGVHALTVVAVDAAGFTRSSAAVKVTMDTALPTVGAPAMTLRADSTARGVPVTVAVSATDRGTGICSLSATVNGHRVGSARTGKLSVRTVLPANRGATVKITAKDCIGRVATRSVSVGATLAGNTAGVFSGSWSTERSSSFAGGSARVTSAGGAKASWTFTGSKVGWVGSRRSWTGTATMYVDGKYAGKVDTRGAWSNRRLMWTRSVSPGRHRLTVVVGGTRGRPTVFQDGFVGLK